MCNPNSLQHYSQESGHAFPINSGIGTRYSLSKLIFNTVSEVLELLLQDGGVEGCALSSSYKSTKITTRCWTTIDQWKLEFPQRRIPTSKEKEAAAMRWYEGYNQDEIKSHILWVSDPHTGEYQGISPTIVNILNPNVRLPNMGIQQRD